MAALDVQALQDRLGNAAGHLTFSQRLVAIGAFVGVIIGVYAFAQWSGQADMAVLYTNLETSDAASVVEELESRNIPYELEAGGSTILVPRSGLYDTRLALSADGMPGGGSAGYSLLDNQGITTSDFTQRVTFQRALEGELARTIRALDSVSAADVHLVIPRENVFVGDDVESTASVLVRTENGTSLTDDNVQAIVNLVASSVEGLATDAVTVADTDGNVLAAPGIPIGTGDSGTTDAMTYGQMAARDLEAMLTAVVGVGNAVVTVSAELDFDQTSTTTETFGESETVSGDPLRFSDRVLNEAYTSAGLDEVEGTLGEDIDDSVAGNADSDAEYNRNEAETQYAIDRVVTATEQATGSVKRLSVAVLLNADTADAALVAEVETIVAAAVGIDPERGDVLAVSSVAFDETVSTLIDDQAAELEAVPASSMVDQAKWGALVALVVLIVLIAWRNLRKAAKLTPLVAGDDEVDDEDDAEVEVEDAATETTSAAASSATGGATATPAVTAPSEQDVEQLIDNQPDDVARLLRTWLDEKAVAQ